MPNRANTLANLTRPRLLIAVARGLVTGAASRLRVAGLANANTLAKLIRPRLLIAVARGPVTGAASRLRVAGLANANTDAIHGR